VSKAAKDIDRIVETAIYLQAESRRLARLQCARHNITATQLNVLKLLQQIGDLSLSQLSRRLASKNSTLTGIVDRMESAQLVHRQQSTQDRRVWNISLAPRGKKIAEDIEVAPWDLLRAALKALPQGEKETLITTLNKIANHVSDAVSMKTNESNSQPTAKVSGK